MKSSSPQGMGGPVSRCIRPSQDEAEAAVATLLRYIGEETSRDGLLDTPARVARAWKEMTSGGDIDVAAILGRTFDVKHSQMITVPTIRFSSLCEHHVLPFTGTVVVGYIPGEKVVGLSKIPRLVEVFAKRLQVQERLTDQIADAMVEHLKPQGVGVLIRAHHACMGCRGVRQWDATMITNGLRGAILEDASARAEFLAHAREG